MSPEIIGTLVRTILIAVGGIFTAKGYIDNDTVQQIASAAAIIIGAVWGVVEKMRRPKVEPDKASKQAGFLRLPATLLLLALAVAVLSGCAGVSPAQLKAAGADRDANALCVDFQGPGWATKTRYLSVNRDVLRSGGAQVTPDCGIAYQDQGKPASTVTTPPR